MAFIFSSKSFAIACTKAVVAILAELSDEVGVVDFGVPVNVGEFLSALFAIEVFTAVCRLDMSACTNAVVAILMELSDEVGVVDFGVPVKLGEFLSALSDRKAAIRASTFIKFSSISPML